jgi:hypothetical protein
MKSKKESPTQASAPIPFAQPLNQTVAGTQATTTLSTTGQSLSPVLPTLPTVVPTLPFVVPFIVPTLRTLPPELHLMIFDECDDCTVACLSLTSGYFQATQRRRQRLQGRPKLTIDSLMLQTTLNAAVPVYLFELIEDFMTRNAPERTRLHYCWLASVSLAVVENPQWAEQRQRALRRRAIRVSRFSSLL